MKNKVTVNDVIQKFNNNGINGVKSLLNNPNSAIYENTWVSKIKDLLNKGCVISVILELELTKNKLYERESINQKGKERIN